MLPAGLLRDLQAIVGPEGVIAEEENLAVYDRDGFTLLSNRPDAVVLPRSTSEAAAVMKQLHAHGTLVIPRGAGTSLSGGTLALGGGVVVGTARMKRVRHVDARSRIAHVEAGLANAELSRRIAPLRLMYAPDPSSQNSASIGGNIATNAGGPHTLKYGVTVNHVLGLVLVRVNGEIQTIGGATAEPPDTGLLSAVIGSEGRLGLVCEAWVRLVPLERHLRTLFATFDCVEDAANVVVDVTQSGVEPVAMEMMDRMVIGLVAHWLPAGVPHEAEAALLIELDGIEAGLDERLTAVDEICRRHRAQAVRTTKDPDVRADLWRARKGAFGAIGRISSTYCTQDGVVPPSQLPHILGFIRETAARLKLRIGNVLHAGDGNIHPVILYDENQPDEIARVLAASDAILNECLRVGGSITGEHGVGAEKREHLRRMYRNLDLAPMEAMRDAFDPEHRMNRGKVVAEAGMDERLSSLIKPMRRVAV